MLSKVWPRSLGRQVYANSTTAETVDRNSLRERHIAAPSDADKRGGIVAGMVMEQDRRVPAEEAVGRDGTEAEEASTRGWEALAEWTGEVSPDGVDVLRGVRELEFVYPLLHALVGRSLREFFVRAAALEALVAAGRASFSVTDLSEALYWLGDDAREATVRALRQAGWLDYDASQGTTITDAGRWAYDVLSFLHRRLQEAELLPTLAGVTYALDIGVDPLRHLQSMRSRLVALYGEIEAARASHSEVVLRQAARRIDDALALSAQLRAVLDRVPLDHRSARRVVREIHDLLSRLLGGSAELHRAVTEVGRQYLHLTAGVTVEQIVRALMRESREDLAAVGREALLPALAPPPLLTTDAVAHAAEVQVARERRPIAPVPWEEPPEAPRVPDAAAVPAEALAWIADLVAVARAEEPVPFSRLVPRHNAGESFLRASLLPLAGDGRAGEGVAGQLGAVAVQIISAGDGWPARLEDVPLSALSPGQVAPRT